MRLDSDVVRIQAGFCRRGEPPDALCRAQLLASLLRPVYPSFSPIRKDRVLIFHQGEVVAAGDIGGAAVVVVEPGTGVSVGAGATVGVGASGAGVAVGAG